MGWAQEVVVLRSFAGDFGPGPKDNPDNTGGVGPSHVVDCTDANIVIHEKTDGKVLKRMTQSEFWKNAKPGFTLPTLCEIRASDGVLLQEGFVDAPDHDYLVPSLAVDANRNVGLGCTRTSATELPSVCVMVHAASDPKNMMRAPVVVAKSPLPS